MLQRWLAAWFAVLLAIAPFAHPAGLSELAPVPAAASEAFVADDDVQGKQPAAGLRPDQPFTPGILSRIALPETTLGLPPLKPPLLRPGAEQPVLAQGSAAVAGAEPRAAFQRSSVGTARTPTGPPA